jgi:hypothetical protein
MKWTDRAATRLTHVQLFPGTYSGRAHESRQSFQAVFIVPSRQKPRSCLKVGKNVSFVFPIHIEYIILLDTRFEVFRKVKMWILTPCSLVGGYQLIAGTHRLHLRGKSGGDTFLRNVCNRLQD